VRVRSFFEAAIAGLFTAGTGTYGSTAMIGLSIVILEGATRISVTTDNNDKE
jgi:hypothetical protein